MAYFLIKEDAKILTYDLKNREILRIKNLKKGDLLKHIDNILGVIFNFEEKHNVDEGLFSFADKFVLDGITTSFDSIIYEQVDFPELMIPFDVLPSVINNKHLNQTLIQWRLDKGV